MNCHDCEELLQRRLDDARRGVRYSEPRGSGPISVDLDRHLAECQACRHTHAAAGLLLETIESMSTIAAPLDFAWKTTAAVLRDRIRRRQKMRERVLITAGLAASILLMAWIGNVLLPERNRHGQESVPQLANHGQETVPQPKEPETVPQQKEPKPEEPIPPLADDVRLAMLSFKDRLPDPTKGHAFVLIAAPREVPDLEAEMRHLAARPLVEPLDPATQSIRQAGHEVSQGLDIVAGNARRAIDFFVKEHAGTGWQKLIRTRC